ncbi:MAG: S8 family serine peptidase [Microthrixaceae bacterium]
MTEHTRLGTFAFRRQGGSRVRACVALLLSTLLPGLAAAPAQALLPPPTPVHVIVQQLNPNDPGPAALVSLLGGTVDLQLPIVTGFAATIPSTGLGDLAAHPGVRVVSGDHVVVPASVATGTPGPSVHRDVIGSSAANAQGLTGAGTTVAVIDSGIAAVAALADNVVPVAQAGGGTQPCVNLSTEAGCDDTFGHGTFVAGMVHSVAPDADLLAVKLSGRDGASNVSTVLAALQWVITNRSTYGIDIVNLSLRTDSSLSYRLDPMNLAVEQVWANGMTVVVAAGNQGGAASTIAKPGDDPWVITVGASDDHGTVSTADDTVADFSSRGPTLADGITKPDVVAPGRSLHSLRSPGSEADIRYPYFVDDSYRLGSGTSFSAPEVAGAAALLLQADPTASNDRIKFALSNTARPLGAANDAGHGIVDITAALAAPAGSANTSNFHPLLFPSGAPSAQDLLGTQYAGTSWQGTSWQGTSWQGTSWQGTSWQGTSWQGTSWQGTSWQGTSWQGTSWQGTSWQGTSWQGTSWQ